MYYFIILIIFLYQTYSSKIYISLYYLCLVFFIQSGCQGKHSSHTRGLSQQQYAYKVIAQSSQFSYLVHISNMTQPSSSGRFVPKEYEIDYEQEPFRLE